MSLSTDSRLFACDLKFDRALQHLEALGEAGKRFGEEQLKGGVVLMGEQNPDRTKYLFSVEVAVHFPIAEWGIIVGDAVHSLRSALDQLVYALSDDPDRRGGFPVCLTYKEWKTDALRLKWGVPES